MGKVDKDGLNNILCAKIKCKMTIPEGINVIDVGGRLNSDFNLDSLDVMEIIMEAEGIYGIKVDNKKIGGLVTVSDLWNLISSY